MFLFVIFVKEIILKYNKQSSGSIWISGDRDEHVCSGIDRTLLFPDDSVHSEIHFIVNDRLLDTSCIYKILLIFHFAVVYFEADKHSVV